MTGRARGVQFEGMTEAQVDEHARRAAEFLWWTARQDVTALAMTRDDLATVLGNEADVDYLFRLFDVNGDQFVLIEEVQQRFTQMYRYAPTLAPTCSRRLTGRAGLQCPAPVVAYIRQNATHRHSCPGPGVLPREASCHASLAREPHAGSGATSRRRCSTPAL